MNTYRMSRGDILVKRAVGTRWSDDLGEERGVIWHYFGISGYSPHNIAF